MLSDSLSVFKSIANLKCDHALLVDLLNLYFRLICDNKDIVFAWVSGHVGIRGHSVVDLAAKRAPEKPVKRVLEKPVKRALEKPVKRALEKPVKRVLEKPVKRVLEKPVKRVLKKPVKRALEKPVNKRLAVPYSDFKVLTSMYTKKLWQTECERSPENKLYTIQPKVVDLIPSHGLIPSHVYYADCILVTHS